MTRRKGSDMTDLSSKVSNILSDLWNAKISPVDAHTSIMSIVEDEDCASECVIAKMLQTKFLRYEKALMKMRAISEECGYYRLIKIAEEALEDK